MVLSADTRASDLVIAEPARTIGDMVCAAICPGSDEASSRIQSMISNYFGDVTKPSVAVPGARSLHSMDVLASGMLYHDALTGLVSASAAILAMPANPTPRTWAAELNGLLPQKFEDTRHHPVYTRHQSLPSDFGTYQRPNYPAVEELSSTYFT